MFSEIKEPIKEHGSIINWKAKAFSLGLMAENMKAIIKTIKEMDMELFIGVMEKFIKEIGKMENKVEKANSILLLIKNGEKAFGMKIRLNGN